MEDPLDSVAAPTFNQAAKAAKLPDTTLGASRYIKDSASDPSDGSGSALDSEGSMVIQGYERCLARSLGLVGT